MILIRCGADYRRQSSTAKTDDGIFDGIGKIVTRKNIVSHGVVGAIDDRAGMINLVSYLEMIIQLRPTGEQ